MTKEWTCFHCGETFQDEECAQVHFGHHEDADPGCILRMQPGEEPLLQRIRELEAEISDIRYQLLDNDSATDRRMHGMIAEHRQALIREEEKGYAEGLRDGRVDHGGG